VYDALLQLLQASSVTHNPHIIDLKVYGPNAFRVKMQAMVTPTLTFQVWLNHNPRYTRYAYQLFSLGNALLRWDNAPHHPYLKTNFPHHFHDDQGRTVPSVLQGDPLRDLPVVLAEIEQFISTTPTTP
jgi:hypothetical protein